MAPHSGVELSLSHHEPKLASLKKKSLSLQYLKEVYSRKSQLVCLVLLMLDFSPGKVTIWKY